MIEPYFTTERGTLYHGDCLEVMAGLPDSSVDMVLTDPPYGTTACKWDSIIPLEPMWEQLKRIIKPTTPVVMTASQPFTSKLIMSNVKYFKHEWVWIKNRGSNFANTVREPMKEHEAVVVFCERNWTYNRQMQERIGGGVSRVEYDVSFKTSSENYRKFDDKKPKQLPKLRVPSTWQKFNTEVGFHPTQKPVALMEYLINTYTNKGDTVLDFTMGSGTTGVACENLRRRFIGIEQDEHYCEIAANRIKKATQQLDLFEDVK